MLDLEIGEKVPTAAAIPDMLTQKRLECKTSVLCMVCWSYGVFEQRLECGVAQKIRWSRCDVKCLAQPEVIRLGRAPQEIS